MMLLQFSYNRVDRRHDRSRPRIISNQGNLTKNSSSKYFRNFYFLFELILYGN